MTNILSKERVDELMNARDMFTWDLDPRMARHSEVKDMATELSELRKLVANKWRVWRKEAWYCYFCDYEIDDSDPSHAPDCIVLRYTDYKDIDFPEAGERKFEGWEDPEDGDK